MPERELVALNKFANLVTTMTFIKNGLKSKILDHINRIQKENDRDSLAVVTEAIQEISLLVEGHAFLKDQFDGIKKDLLEQFVPY